MINLRFGGKQDISQDFCISRRCTAHAIRRNPGAVAAALLASAVYLNAQTAASGAFQLSGTQLPLSGRRSSSGSVSTTQSIRNSGGENSLNIIDTKVSFTSPYNGSVPDLSNINLALPLTLDNALKLGLRNNPGQISRITA